MRVRTMYVAIVWILSNAGAVFPCRTDVHYDPKRMVAAADLILRVIAVEYSGPPPSARLRIGPAGLPDSDIRFQVDEVVKGSYDKTVILLPGYLGVGDDWNPQNPPYTSVRPSGKGGSCFANTYRRGGEFLLMLKKWYPAKGSRRLLDGYTIQWYPLGPVNEQVRSSDDPWVQWVREQVGPK